MLGSERKLYILRELEEHGILKMRDICESLNTSESSIRRDLEELEQLNQLKRVHGGALKLTLGTTLTTNREKTMVEKSKLCLNAKKEICKLVATYVEDGDCIFVDGGTTLMYLADFLEGKRVKIVSHNNFIEIKEDSTIELIRIGGTFLAKYNMNVGSIAVNTLSAFNFDYAFIGCAGIEVKKGIAYASDLDSAQVKLAAMNQSIKSFLLIDESKLDVRGFYNFSSLSDFESVILDSYSKKGKKPSYITIAK